MKEILVCINNIEKIYGVVHLSIVMANLFNLQLFSS